VLAPAGQEVLLDLVEDARELLLGRGLELAGGADRLEHAAVVAQVLEQLALEVADVLDLDVVELALGAGPDGDDLLLHRERRALGLLEQLHQAGTAVQLLLRGRIQVGGEHREGLEVPELGEVDLQRARDRLHGLRLRGAADAGDRNADVDRRALVRVEQVRLQEALPVGDRDDVGGDVGRDVVRLGLDDRQAGHRAAAHLVAELRAALEQTGVQVEDVTGVGLTTRRTAQQQRHGARGFGLLRQVVEDDHAVLTLGNQVLADGGAGVGGDVLEARRVGGESRDDGGVLHRAVLLERGAHRGDGRALLADGDVDAAHLLVGVAGLPVGLLVQDRVDPDRGLARLAVADDQLALAAADRGHRVDGLQAGLHRLLDGLALHDAGRLQLEGAAADGVDGAEAVDGGTGGVDHAAEVAVADRDREHLAGAADLLTLLDARELAED